MTSYPYTGAWRDHCGDCYSDVDLPYGEELCRSCAAARQTGVDLDTVRRLAAGYGMPLATRAERALAARWLHEKRYSVPAIANRMHVSVRSVQRYLAVS